MADNYADLTPAERQEALASGVRFVWELPPPIEGLGAGSFQFPQQVGPVLSRYELSAPAFGEGFAYVVACTDPNGNFLFSPPPYSTLEQAEQYMLTVAQGDLAVWRPH